MRPGTLLRWYALKDIMQSKINGDEVILDIGGYDGVIACNLREIFPEIKITVIDMDESGLELGKKHGLNVLRASAMELPIEDASVDMVFCFDMIEHIDEERRLLSELSRVLKGGGKILLTTPMEGGISFPFMSKQKVEEINKSWGHIKLGYSLKAITELFNEAGLRVEKADGYFSFLTRLVYRFAYTSMIPLPGMKMVYKLIVRAEPFYKFRTQEHIVVGGK